MFSFPKIGPFVRFEWRGERAGLFPVAISIAQHHFNSMCGTIL